MRKPLTYLLLTILSLVGIHGQTALGQDIQDDVKTVGADFHILHHERIQSLKLDVPPPLENEGKSARQAEQAYATTLTFDAFGRQFVVFLTPNQRLIADLPKEQRQRLEESMTAYHGYIDGVDDSWVRINRTGDRISGVMWDGVELYIIDTSDRVASQLGDKQSGPSQQALQLKPYPLIYRLSDTESDAGGCAVDPTAEPSNNYQGLVDELRSLTQALPAVAQKLDVAIVADRQFVDANSDNPDAAVVARMNIVDGIYSGQVGVQINVTEIRSLRNNGGLSSSQAGSLLDQFSDFADASDFTNPGLAHLFTGRDLNGGVVGVAFIGSLCKEAYGVGLSQTTGRGTVGALTVAHEIGHNFGAPHDNQGGSPCASTPGNFIMNPFGNGSDQFSQCSLGQMQPHIDRATCITEVDDPDLLTETADIRAIIPTTPIETTVLSDLEYRIEVRNSGVAVATNATAEISIPDNLTIVDIDVDAGQCDDNQDTVNCDFGDINGNTTRTISLQLQAGAIAETLTSTVKVSSDNDANPGNNSTEVRINVRADNGTTVFQSDFDADTDGFEFVADAFRETNQPRYATGRHSAWQNDDGVLTVILGGRDNRSVLNMSGGWRKSFTLSSPSKVTLSFDYRIVQAPDYERDEYSETLLSVDGKLMGAPGGSFLTRITGDGNGGSWRTFGWQSFQVELGELSAGEHTITVGGFNNKKTYANERTIVDIDNVKADSAP